MNNFKKVMFVLSFSILAKNAFVWSEFGDRYDLDTIANNKVKAVASVALITTLTAKLAGEIVYNYSTRFNKLVNDKLGSVENFRERLDQTMSITFGACLITNSICEYVKGNDRKMHGLLLSLFGGTVAYQVGSTAYKYWTNRDKSKTNVIAN